MTRTRLDSWKSIAEYLKRSPRTVQRWHAEAGLPVHHFGGGKGPVFCYPEELDAWLSGTAKTSQDAGAGGTEVFEGRKRSEELAARAGEMWDIRSERNLASISSLYRQAVDEDPGNAGAFIGLANALVLSALFGRMRNSAAFPRASEALERGMRLGAEKVEAQCAAAWLHMCHERRWKRAREGFDEVLSKRPESTHALSGRALLHLAEGSIGNAAHLLEEAWRRTTLSPILVSLNAWAGYLSGNFARTLDSIDESRVSGDCEALGSTCEALALTQSGPIARRLERLEAIAAQWPQSSTARGALGYGYALCSQQNRAAEIAQGLKRAPKDAAYAIALVHIGLEERQQAIACLDVSFEEGSLWSLGFRVDPILEPLRGEARFEAITKKLGSGR